MAQTNSKKSIRDIFKRLEDAIDKSIDAKQLRPIAKFTIDLIVKRTRLGYGVDRQFGTKKKLKPLSDQYIEYRRSLSGKSKPKSKTPKIFGARSVKLSEFTNATRSNLTLTGQMLDSMTILSERGKSISIGPQGKRNEGGPTNDQIADYQASQGRVFNRVSLLEFKQIVREYRRTFGDLLKKSKLIQ